MKLRLFSSLILLTLILAACGAPIANPGSEATRAAATIYAKLTADAPTLTPTNPPTPTRTATLIRTATLMPTPVDISRLPAVIMPRPVTSVILRKETRPLVQKSQAGLGVGPKVAFAPDMHSIVVGTKAGLAHYAVLWPSTTQSQLGLKRYATMEAGVTAVEVLPDLIYALVGRGDGSLLMWNMNTWTFRDSVKAHSSEIGDIVLLRGGKAAATAGTYGDGSIAIWSLPALKEEKRLKASDGAVFDLAASEDGSALLAYRRQKGIYYWKDGAAQEVLLAGASDANKFDRFGGVALNKNGTLAAYIRDDGLVDVLKAPEGSLVTTLNTRGDGVQALVFRELDASLVSMGASKAKTWKTADWSEADSQPGLDNWVSSVSFLPARYHAAVGSYNGSIYFWDLKEKRVVGSTGGFYHEIAGSAISSDASKVYFGVYANTSLYQWNLVTGEVKAILNQSTGYYSAVAADPTGKLLAASGGSRGVIDLLDPASLKKVGELSGHTGIVHEIAFSPNGLYAASVSADKSMRIWSVADKKEIGKLAMKSMVYGLPSFSNDSRRVAVADGEWLPVWDVPSRSLAASNTGSSKSTITSAAFSPDGTILLSGTQNTTTLIDTKTWRNIVETNVTASTNFAFCKDPELLVFGTSGGTLMHAAVTAKGIVPLSIDQQSAKLRIGAVQCSPKNDFVLTSSADGTLRIFASP